MFSNFKKENALIERGRPDFFSTHSIMDPSANTVGSSLTVYSESKHVFTSTANPNTHPLFPGYRSHLVMVGILPSYSFALNTAARAIVSKHKSKHDTAQLRILQ